MGYFIRNLARYREYIRYSAKAQLKSEISDSFLGCIWWVLEPTLFMFVYYFVYTLIFKQATEYVVIVINIGLLYWRFLSSCLTASIRIVQKNSSVISKIYLPKFVLVCTLMLVNGFKMLCASVPIAVLLIIYKVPVTYVAFQIIPVTLAFFMIVFSLCCWFLHIGVYFRDLDRIVPIVLRVLFYLSGVFYPVDAKLGAEAAEYMLRYNPAAAVITDVRNALLYSENCHWTQLGIQVLVFFVLGIIALTVIKHKEDEYIKIV